MSWSGQWPNHLHSHFTQSPGLGDMAAVASVLSGEIEHAPIHNLFESTSSSALNSAANGTVLDPKLQSEVLPTAWNGYSTPLDPKFVRQEKPKKFFVQGKVFRVLWAQPAGEQNPYVRSPSKRYRNRPPSGSGSNNTIWVGNHGGKVFQDVKMFVVVREGHNYCTAVQITSYQGQGVSKHEVLKSEHAIAYTGYSPPGVLQEELPRTGEAGMLAKPIRIVPDIVDGHQLYLKQPSRVNFGKQYTIEHNVLVQSFGRVHEASLDTMISQFRTVHHPHWNSDLTNTICHEPDSSRNATSGSSKDPSTAVYKVISGTGAQEIEGDMEYQVRLPEFYYEGKVFTTKGCKETWPTGTRQNQGRKKGKSRSLPSVITEAFEGFDENGSIVIGQKLWFVVIKSGRTSSLCLRILSYENQGVALGYALDEHSAVYIGKKRPKMSSTEIVGHGIAGTLKEPIRIIPFDRASELLPTHRIRYSTLYRVQHNVMSCPFGTIHDKFNWYLKQQTRTHFRTMEQDSQLSLRITGQQPWREALGDLSSSESDEYDEPREEDSFVLRSDITAPDCPRPMFKEGDRILLPTRDKPKARARFRPLLVKERKVVPSSWRWEYKLKYEKHEGEFAGGLFFAEEKLIGDPLD